jgi:hypothetical protein
MDTNVDCPRCGTSLTVDEDVLGRPFTCPSCQGTVTIPKKKLPLPPQMPPLASALSENGGTPDKPEDIPPLHRSPWVPGPPEAPGMRVVITDIRIPFLTVFGIALRFLLAGIILGMLTHLILLNFFGVRLFF